MTGEELLFFNHRPEAVAVYAAFEEALKKRLGPLEPRVQKSQITYAAPKVFACVSLPRKRGESGILVSLGLGRREGSPPGGRRRGALSWTVDKPHTRPHPR